MANKEGSNFTFGDIKQEGTGHAVVDQSEGKTITVNNGPNEADIWSEVEEVIGDEVPEEEQEMVVDALARLRENIEAEEPDKNIIDQAIETLKPYKSIGKVLLSAAKEAVKLAPGGVFVVPLIAGAYELVK